MFWFHTCVFLCLCSYRLLDPELFTLHHAGTVVMATETKAADEQVSSPGHLHPSLKLDLPPDAKLTGKHFIKFNYNIQYYSVFLHLITIVIAFSKCLHWIANWLCNSFTFKWLCIEHFEKDMLFTMCCCWNHLNSVVSSDNPQFVGSWQMTFIYTLLMMMM